MCKLKKYKDCNVRIDECIKSFILSLKGAGFKTLGSCCGHGKYPLTVIIQTRPKNRNPFNVELISGKIIPRKRNFYKRDEEGYYFIPEVVDG